MPMKISLDVLLDSGRGHTSADLYTSSALIKEYGFNLGLQMMVGLPSDTLEKDIYTCREFIKLDPYCVRIYPTLIIKDTYLEEKFLKEEYLPIPLDEAVDRCSILLMIFIINDINVIRIGLQPTENIQLGKDVVAGPFHPAFRQLVETNIYKILLNYYFKENNIRTIDEILLIEANGKNISSIAGQKSSNKVYLQEKYKFKNIKFYTKDMEINHIKITIGDFCGKINMKLLMEDYLKANIMI